MAQGLFTLKQVNQALRQGAWSSASTTPVYAAGFNGSSQYLNVSSSTIASTGQFCIEAWVFQTSRSISSSQGIFSQYSAGVSGRFYFRFNADKLSFTTSAGDNISTSSVYVNTWYHVAVTRDASNVLRLFINGVLDYNATVTQSLLAANAQLGGIANGELWNGYISNLRTVSGAIPTSYQTSSTTNGTVVFTPPTTNLTTTSQGASGTSLLTLQNATIIDNSSNAYTITNNGTVAMALNYGVFNPTIKTSAVEYLVVAGGGGGGGCSSTTEGGGGGGAGGLLNGVVSVASGTSYTVTVGAGGSALSGSTLPTNGSNSVFGNMTSVGGGFGGVSYLGSSQYTAGSGGSGGGGPGAVSGQSTNGGQGVANQGNTGGFGSIISAAGGGGGAGTAGLPGVSSYAGTGGAGIASVISGTVTTYAGGGGSGGTNAVNASVGGVGGGGNGGVYSGSAATSGTANTGGGGGAGARDAGASGAGGSGIVIVSYPDTYAAPTSTTGSPTVSTSGSGSIALNGSSQYIVSNQQLNFGSGNFTAEVWVYSTSFSSNQAIFDFRVSAGVYPVLYIGTDGKLNWLGNNSTLLGTSTNAISLNTWTHVAVVRSGTTDTFYINGVANGTFSDSSSYNGNYVSIGVSGLTSDSRSAKFSGYMSNMRFVVGTAVYTGSFTVPTAPLPTITNTTLLLNTTSGAYLADASSSATTFTNTGSVAWNSSSPFATGLGYKNRVYTWTSSGSITF